MPIDIPPPRLTRGSLSQGVLELSARDRRLAAIVEAYGPPPLLARPRGFTTLVWIILEQQVSLASAASLHRKLGAAVPGGLTPAGVAALGVTGLQALGLTRQKARYVSGLAGKVVSREFRLDRLSRMTDAEAERALLDVPGIGPWTAGVYLLMALRRPDVWPPGDLGLHKSLAEVRCVRGLPSSAQAAEYALRWRPWRAVAARLLWHSYLSRRRRQWRVGQRSIPLRTNTGDRLR
jgi:DNA-3-methyladenine glycosylase II